MDVYDCENGADYEIIITDKLVNKVTSKYNQMLKDYPEIDKIFQKYSKDKKPQLYVMQNIW
jgi:hemoglobin-like flavoprotein